MTYKPTAFRARQSRERRAGGHLAFIKRSGDSAKKGSGPGSLGMRNVGFFDRIAAPAIEGVVERKPGFELREIVGVHSRQSKRCGQQACGLRREVRTSGIGAPDDRGKTQQRLGGQAENFDHEIERAFVASMAPKHAFKIERYGTVPLGHVWNLGGCNKKEYSAGVDKAAN